jgi:hypothetical protein
LAHPILKGFDREIGDIVSFILGEFGLRFLLAVGCLCGDKILLLGLMIDAACIKERQADPKRP